MIGQTISHYRIMEFLGEGAMGIVYLAEDITLGRRVAIKFLSSITPDYRARFLREARAVSILTHPNIATVYDYGETTEGQPYIVMELIKGQPLNEKLQEGSLPLPEAVRIVTAIAAALGEAHHQGIVHRDVKPSNVVIADRGHVKVLDFGLVKQIDQFGPDAEPNRATLPGVQTRSDVIVGTPLYLSPEQARGKKIDGRSDLFALGAVLYECITGHSAFAGASVIEIGAQVIHVTPQLPSKLNHQIPPELDRITMKAIEKSVEARYQTAEEMIDELNALLPSLPADGFRSGGRITKPLVPPRTHSASALRTLTETFRRPRLSLGTFILVFVGLALLGWALSRWLKPGPYNPPQVARDWYNSGTDALRNGAFLQASKAFEQAVQADPAFPLAHARLAEASFELDYPDKAKDEMLKVQTLVPNRSQLAPSDALHLEAINATVTRDFPGAIKAYSELARLTPDEPQVYVDLGRAYEKNDELKNAIASFVEATNRAPQYATAFLRVGVLYARQLDQPSATAGFDRADAIYQALGAFEGQAEVAFQRGVLFDQVGNPGEARRHLQRALELARTTVNEYQQVRTILRLGGVELDANDPVKARKFIQEGIDLAQAKGIDNLTKRGLIDMGNTFHVEGNYTEAEKYYRESLELSQRQKDPRNAARALLSLGSIAERRGNIDEVLSYVEQALPFYQQGGYRKETIQAFALLARAKVHKGQYDEALQAVQQQLLLAQQLGDQAQASSAHADIGRLFIRQGNYLEALEHSEKSVALSQSLGVPKNIALSLTDSADALWRLGRYDKARAALVEAAPVAERPDAAKNLSSWYYLTSARMALSERNYKMAVNNSKQALALAGMQVKSVGTQATFTLGLAQASSGESRAGQINCQEAVEMARQSGDPALLSEALLSLAEAQLQTGDSEGALKNSLEAQQIFARSGNLDSEWRALLIAARVSQSAGDSQHAKEYAARADNLLSNLQQKWGDTFNTYLGRPDVQFSRKQLSELVAKKT